MGQKQPVFWHILRNAMYCHCGETSRIRILSAEYECVKVPKQNHMT